MAEHLTMAQRSALWKCPAFRAAQIAMRAKTAAENRAARAARRERDRRRYAFSGGRLRVAHA